MPNSQGSSEDLTDHRVSGVERKTELLEQSVEILRNRVHDLAGNVQSLTSTLENREHEMKSWAVQVTASRSEISTEIKEIKTILIGDGKTRGVVDRLIGLEATNNSQKNILWALFVGFVTILFRMLYAYISGTVAT